MTRISPMSSLFMHTESVMDHMQSLTRSRGGSSKKKNRGAPQIQPPPYHPLEIVRERKV
jgi:hypothetical protein